jgi:hypothetical protein
VIVGETVTVKTPFGGPVLTGTVLKLPGVGPDAAPSGSVVVSIAGGRTILAPVRAVTAPSDPPVPVPAPRPPLDLSALTTPRNADAAKTEMKACLGAVTAPCDLDQIMDDHAARVAARHAQ